ncbi:MAG: hypothetical protein ABSE25_14300 [Syntrophorhabdales bacterium]
MVRLQMNDEEAGMLRIALENYTTQLDVEIHRTESRDFREALEARERVLHDIIGRLKKGGSRGSQGPRAPEA